MPKPFSTSGLPLPSSSRRPANGLLAALAPRLRRRGTLLVLCIGAVFLITILSNSGPSFGLNDSQSWASRLGARKGGYQAAHRTPPPVKGGKGAAGVGYERDDHGIDEESIMAENELAVDNAVEAKPKSDAERAADKAAEEQTVLSRAEEKKNQLRALIWWLSKDGHFPTYDYDPPSTAELAKMTGKQFANLLMRLSGVEHPSPDPFADKDWETDASMYLGLTIFSKSYCPFSMRGKEIISKYPINPKPNIIELDMREDGPTIQDLLMSLTGRRTVPNIIAGFQSIGGADEITLLDGEGTLARKLLAAHTHPK